MKGREAFIICTWMDGVGTLENLMKVTDSREDETEDWKIRIDLSSCSSALQ